jgi:exosortase
MQKTTSIETPTAGSSGIQPAKAKTAAGLAFLAQPWSIVLLGLGVCWLIFFNELRGEWEINAQYNYGYVVPFLAAALVWRRWPERPSPQPPTTLGSVVLPAACLLALLFPIRLVLEANPEWRLIYWLHGVQVIGLSLCLLYALGGAAWVRFFAPPIAFTLIAVPWPMELEQWAIQGLMRFVAALTVEVAGWFSIPAVQHGNLIETTVGLVGIDEACSGVRSLQSALMLSLFLGEMHRFSLGRRAALLAASLVFDLLANLGRTSFLVWAAANRGLAQMEAWHDTAGMLVMLIVLPCLLGLAYLLRPKAQPSAAMAPGARLVLPGLSKWAAFVILLWIGATELTTQAWYGFHEMNLVATPRWSLEWPTQQFAFKKTAVPEKSLAILRCSNSEAGAWQDDAGNQWSAFLLRWKPGRNSAQLAKGHRPDICFPAAGAHLVADYGQTSMRVDDFELPFRHQTFDLGGKTAHVFYCLWPDRVSPNEKPLLEDGSQLSRLYAVLAGKRHLGQQVLEIVIQGPDTKADADDLLRKSLPSLIRKG